MRYVGKSCSGLHRTRQHLKTWSLRSGTHKNHWLRQVLASGLQPEVEILETFTDSEELAQAEMFWIAYFCGIGCPLTNGTDGGDGLVGATPAVRAKLSSSHRGRKLTAEHRQAISRSMQGLEKGEAHRAALSVAHLGRKRGPQGVERRRAMAVKLGGRPFLDETGRRWVSVAEAARFWSIQKSNLRAVLKGRQPRAGGHVFLYEDCQ